MAALGVRRGKAALFQLTTIGPLMRWNFPEPPTSLPSAVKGASIISPLCPATTFHSPERKRNVDDSAVVITP